MTIENSMEREPLQKKMFQKKMTILDKYGIYMENIYVSI